MNTRLMKEFKSLCLTTQFKVYLSIQILKAVLDCFCSFVLEFHEIYDKCHIFNCDNQERG